MPTVAEPEENWLLVWGGGRVGVGGGEKEKRDFKVK